MSDATILILPRGAPRRPRILPFHPYTLPLNRYFEVVNLTRRLMLTCMVVMCRTLAQTTCFVLFVTIYFLVLEREARPYTNQFVSAFTYV